MWRNCTPVFGAPAIFRSPVSTGAPRCRARTTYTASWTMRLLRRVHASSINGWLRATVAGRLWSRAIAAVARASSMTLPAHQHPTHGTCGLDVEVVRDPPGAVARCQGEESPTERGADDDLGRSRRVENDGGHEPRAVRSSAIESAAVVGRSIQSSSRSRSAIQAASASTDVSSFGLTTSSAASPAKSSACRAMLHRSGPTLSPIAEIRSFRARPAAPPSEGRHPALA